MRARVDRERQTSRPSVLTFFIFPQFPLDFLFVQIWRVVTRVLEGKTRVGERVNNLKEKERESWRKGVYWSDEKNPTGRSPKWGPPSGPAQSWAELTQLIVHLPSLRLLCHPTPPPFLPIFPFSLPFLPFSLFSLSRSDLLAPLPLFPFGRVAVGLLFVRQFRVIVVFINWRTERQGRNKRRQCGTNRSHPPAQPALTILSSKIIQKYHNFYQGPDLEENKSR